jgi:polysaccharide biosynthesis protein PelG
MAGIGFELRKLLRKGTFFDVLRSYGYASVISTGPWVISILGIIGLDFLKYTEVIQAVSIRQFQISITYLIALSLILSGFAQHSYTRYVADRIYEKEPDRIIPNYNGVSSILIIVSGLIGFGLVPILFRQQDFYYQLLMASSFVILNLIWFTTNLLSGLRNYKVILFVFALGYGLTIFIGYCLKDFGLDGLLAGFFIGQLALLIGMVITLYYYYPSNRLIEFDFLSKNKLYISLIFTSFFYNLGIWIDKFIFWFTPITSEQIIGPLRASMMYDVPIFLAYLAIIPGMAVFLFRMETDFVEQYNKYYNAVRNGDTLFNIIQTRHAMINTAREGIFNIIRIQGLVIFLTYILGEKILAFLHISKHYIYLLNIDVIGTSLLVVFLAILNILFYLDRRKTSVLLTGLFVTLNLIFTLITLHLGVFYFGYGFVIALLITNIIGATILNNDFDNLEYETFMQQ